MSIFHLTVRSVSRASGRSAVAAAAYRAGERLTNHRDGRIHDFIGKPVAEAFIIAPDCAPSWTQDRGKLWNAAEAAERRKDAKVAREYELALPFELDAPDRRALAFDFAALLVSRYGVAVDVAIHPPDTEGDQRNHHAHLLTTTRTVTPEGLAAKVRQLDLSTTASVEVEHLRAAWAAMINAGLVKAGVADRVDHRSFERQGKAAEPTVKMGPVITAIERRARRHSKTDHVPPHPVSVRGQLNASIQEMRGLASYVERGRAFLDGEAKKLLKTALTLTVENKRLIGLTTLRRIAGEIRRGGREHGEIDRTQDRTRSR